VTVPESPDRANLAAGFDFARQLRDPNFREHLRSIGHAGGTVHTTGPGEPVAEVLARVERPGLLAAPDPARPHLWALAWVAPATSGAPAFQRGQCNGHPAALLAEAERVDRLGGDYNQAVAVGLRAAARMLGEDSGTSLGEQPHDGTDCHNDGQPHLGPCVEPQGPGFTRDDVVRYAGFISGLPDPEQSPRDLFAAAAVLGGLAQDGRLLAEPAEVRTEFGVRWHTDGDDDACCMWHDRIGHLIEAHELGREKVGRYGAVRYTVRQREHRQFQDGSTWAGPWQPVDEETTDPRTEEG